MKRFTGAVILAVAVAASGSAAMAASHKHHKAYAYQNGHRVHTTQNAHQVYRGHQVPDWSDLYHGYAPNSQEGQRAFWEEQEERQE
jgi:hypothetical protein